MQTTATNAGDATVLIHEPYPGARAFHAPSSPRDVMSRGMKQGRRQAAFCRRCAVISRRMDRIPNGFSPVHNLVPAADEALSVIASGLRDVCVSSIA
jgi:hypothetical protein